jgi:hypothetical protein
VSEEDGAAAYDATESAAVAAGDLANTFNEARKRRLARCRAHCGVEEAAQASVRRHHVPVISSWLLSPLPALALPLRSTLPPPATVACCSPQPPRRCPRRSNPCAPKRRAPCGIRTCARSSTRPPPSPPPPPPPAARPRCPSARSCCACSCARSCATSSTRCVCLVTVRRPDQTTSGANRPLLLSVGGWKRRRAAFSARARLAR